MKIRRTSDCESIVSLTNNDIRFQVKSGAGGESISTVASHKRIYGKDTISKNPKSISLKSEIASRMNRVNYVKKLCIGAITRLKLKVVSRVGERGWGIISFSCSKVAEISKRRELHRLPGPIRGGHENSELGSHRLTSLAFCPRNARVAS